MASTERSLGWTTGVAGTDGASAYDQTRWIKMQSLLNGTNGILNYNQLMTASGISTGTLTIADGAAMVNGFFYETNGSVTFPISGITNGTYNILLVANTSGSAQTVTLSGAGTTTIDSGTVRTALATGVQTTTITTNLTSANVLTLGTMSKSGSLVTAITQNNNVASRMLSAPSNTWAQMTGTVTTTIPNNTNTLLTGSATWNGTNINSVDGNLVYDTTTGYILCKNTTLVLVEVVCTWDANVTGYRRTLITGDVNGTDTFLGTSLLPTASIPDFRHIQIVNLNNVYSARVGVTVYQNSGASRTVTPNMFRVVRLA